MGRDRVRAHTHLVVQTTHMPWASGCGSIQRFKRVQLFISHQTLILLLKGGRQCCRVWNVPIGEKVGGSGHSGGCDFETTGTKPCQEPRPISALWLKVISVACALHLSMSIPLTRLPVGADGYTYLGTLKTKRFRSGRAAFGGLNTPSCHAQRDCELSKASFENAHISCGQGDGGGAQNSFSRGIAAHRRCSASA